ncbi:hypothetical protein OH77DRAFT_484195 [Trametes cingulata]|nr:hypothetical protein OH77DRAFT_484195 [Trametes cingulata]
MYRSLRLLLLRSSTYIRAVLLSRLPPVRVRVPLLPQSLHYRRLVNALFWTDRQGNLSLLRYRSSPRRPFPDRELGTHDIAHGARASPLTDPSYGRAGAPSLEARPVPAHVLRRATAQLPRHHWWRPRARRYCGFVEAAAAWPLYPLRTRASQSSSLGTGVLRGRAVTRHLGNVVTSGSTLVLLFVRVRLRVSGRELLGSDP